MPVSKKRKTKTKSKRRVQHQYLPTNSMALLNDPHTHIVDLNDAPDELKLSAKIIELIEPWIEDVPIELLTDCAALAWNACVNSEENGSSADFFRSSLAHYAEMGQIALIEALRARKNQMFPTDLRTIIRIQVITDGHDDHRINVASELKPAEAIKMLKRLRDMD